MNVSENDFINLIKNNDISEIKKININNNKKKYDFLITAIEENASISFIEMLLENYNSINYSFTYKTDVNVKNKVPLFSAVAMNNFKIAYYLINKAGANINYTKDDHSNIIDYLLYNYNNGKCLLNINNLAFVLKNGFNKMDVLTDVIKYKIINAKYHKYVSGNPNNSVECAYNIKMLKIILGNIIYDNNFIIKLLGIYNNQIPLSCKQLSEMFCNKKHFLNNIYNITLNKFCFGIIEILLDYDIYDTKYEFYEKINKYYLLESNYGINNVEIIINILKYKNINFKLLNFENILSIVFSRDREYNCRRVINKIIDHPKFSFNSIDISKLLKISFINITTSDEPLEIANSVIDIIYKNYELSINNLNFEDTLIEITKYDNSIAFLNEFINKLLNYKYNFKLLNFENVFREIAHNPNGDKTMQYLINIIDENNLCSINEIDFKNILIDSYFYNNEYFNTNISKYLINLLFNINYKNYNSINYEKLKTCNTNLLTLIINIVIEMGDYNILKNILENDELKYRININSKYKEDNYPIFNALYAATNLFYLPTLDNIKIFKYLIDYGADVNKRDESNNSLISLALYYKNYLLINYILKQHIIIEENEINKTNNEITSSIFQGDLKFIKLNLNKIKIDNTKYENDKFYINSLSKSNNDKNFNKKNKQFVLNDNKIISRIQSYDISNSEFKNNDFKELVNDNIEYYKFNTFDTNSNYINYKMTDNTNDYNLLKNELDINDLKSLIDTSYINYEFTPLILAYLLNKNDIFEVLLESCNNINEMDSNNFTIMHYAILKEDVKTIKILIDKEVNINFCSNINGCGHSAFDIAISIGNEEIFSLLLDSNKVQLNQPNLKEEIPLTSIIKNFVLSLNQKKAWIEKIIKQGANVNLINICEYSPLCQAIKCNSLSLTEFLVNLGANVNLCDKNNNYPLTFAILENNLQIIQYLINHGASINYVDNNNEMPLKIAIRWGLLDVVKLLVENGADIHKIILDYNGNEISILGYAIQFNEVEITYYLIEKGADLNYKSPTNGTIYDIAYKQIVWNNLGIIDILFNHNMEVFTDKLIWDAIEIEDYDHIYFVEHLIEHGVDINLKNEENLSILEYAIICKNAELVKYLMDHNANINLEYNLKKTLIEYAICFDDEEIMNLSIKHKFDLNMKIDNEVNNDTKTKENISLIEYAIKRGSSNVVKILIDNGISIDTKTKENKSLIEYAISCGFTNTVETLMYKTGKNIKDNDYRLLMDYANKYNIIDIIKYLSMIKK